MILATDLAKSMDLQDEFKTIFHRFSDGTHVPVSPSANSPHALRPQRRRTAAPSVFPLREPLPILSMFKILVACADIAHPCKGIDVHVHTSYLVLQEFFMQGRKEKELDLPISPLCDSNVVSVS